MTDDPFKHKLSRIENVFEVNDILSLTTSPSRIAQYYRINRLPYWLFVSRRGFVHMGISQDGNLKPEDLNEAARLVSGYITKMRAKNVLELATGKAANLKYLASQHPNTAFHGLDLPGGQTPRKLKGLQNTQIDYGDFHDLGQYRSDHLT